MYIHVYIVCDYILNNKWTVEWVSKLIYPFNHCGYLRVWIEEREREMTVKDSDREGERWEWKKERDDEGNKK